MDQVRPWVVYIGFFLLLGSRSVLITWRNCWEIKGDGSIGASSRYYLWVVNKWKQSIFALRQSASMCTSRWSHGKGSECQGSSLPQEDLGRTEKHRMNWISSSTCRRPMLQLVEEGRWKPENQPDTCCCYFWIGQGKSFVLHFGG